jgi:hypothetical protein
VTYFVDDLDSREYEVVTLPDDFQIYCAKCNGMCTPSSVVRRFDGATYSHLACPKTPLKTFAPHKYGPVR